VSPEALNSEMEGEQIYFTSEDVEFSLPNEASIAMWLHQIIEQEDKSLHLLNFIFCSDKYLHRLNVEYLGHDTLTDIITFPYQEPPIIEGDVFISIERVKENAAEFSTSFYEELRRVMAHGVLHLCGYGDKTKTEEKQMRLKEDEALSLFLRGKK
jgi:rRNA maturation RNase YbeY